MRGKVGLVVGLAAGYVLGTRAGRERFEQIKAQADRVWHLDPVQRQVRRAGDLTRSAAQAIPSAAWSGAVKVTRAAGRFAAGAARPASDAEDMPGAPGAPETVVGAHQAGAGGTGRGPAEATAEDRPATAPAAAEE
jgi:histone H3/H4